MASLDQLDEIFLRAQAAIHAKRVDHVVAVALRLEHRSE